MFYVFIMRVGGDVDSMNAYPTEAEVDVFGKEESGYSELDPDDPPDFWEQYDPPTVIVFEAHDSAVLENGKYERPVAIYQRGEKYICVKQDY